MTTAEAALLINSSTISRAKYAKSTYYLTVQLEGLFTHTPQAKGETVQWGFRYAFPCIQSQTLVISLVTKSLFGMDVIRASGEIALSRLFSTGGLFSAIPLLEKQEPVATVNIDLRLVIQAPVYYASTPMALGQPAPMPSASTETNGGKRVEAASRPVGIDDVRFLGLVYRTADGSSEVHSCVLTPTNQRAVVKVTHCFNPDRYNAVQREGMTMCRMTHPNICRCYESLLNNRNGVLDHWLIMEWIDGVTLTAEVQRRMQGRLSWTEDQLRGYTSRLLDAFAYMQSMSICHSDIKPDNLVFSASGELKVIDFGLSLSNLGPEEGAYRVSGTPNFFSPLQFAAFKAYHAGRNPQSLVRHNPYKSDVYALGLVFLSMAALKFIDGLNDLDRRDLSQVLNREIDSASGGRELKNLLRTMLCIDEGRRPDFLELKKVGYAGS